MTDRQARLSKGTLRLGACSAPVIQYTGRMGTARTALARRWAESGALALTGRSDGPPLLPPDDVVERIVALGERAGADGLAALAERAGFAGLSRQGDVSCGGSCRLLPTGDGWAAVTLAREDDIDLVPAWLELDTPVLAPEGRPIRRPSTRPRPASLCGVGSADAVTSVEGARTEELAAGDVWDGVARAFAGGSGAALVERGRMLGLPVAMVGSVGVPGRDGEPLDGLGELPVLATRFPRVRGGVTRSTPLVVDLSSLWAGPLCARLLGEAGADVVKVEAEHRPDGARRGPVWFFDLLHGGHRAVALDFRTAEGVEALGRLVRAADVVIEASRPRALAQLGLAAEDVLAAGDGPSVWVSITGYGRTGPGRAWVAFGDDAAAAGGLVAWDDAGPCFFADAAADPLSGLAAAAATHAALAAGGTWLLDVAMSEVAAWVAGPSADRRHPPWGKNGGVRGPRLGEHTDEVLAWLEHQR